MSDIREAFKPLAESYKRQFGIELEGEPKDNTIVVSDGRKDGVSRVGSVKSNWLKRNAPKHGFVRKGEGVTFTWTSAANDVELEPAVEAEHAELAAVTTVASEVGEEPTSVEFLHEPVEPDADAQELHVDVADDTNEDDIPEGWRSGRSKKEPS